MRRRFLGTTRFFQRRTGSVKGGRVDFQARDGIKGEVLISFTNGKEARWKTN